MLNTVATFLLGLVLRAGKGGVIINEHILTRAQARFHVQVLGRWFDFIGLGELPDRLNRSTRKPFCLFTFDDGKRSNFSEVAPELERLGVPAVFYLTTGFIDSGSLLWFDRRELLIQKLGFCPPGLELAVLKELPYEVLKTRLDHACARYQIELELDAATDDQRPMSWEEARALHRRGFTIGAHGLTHAILTREPKERAFAEIEESLTMVALNTGASCSTFAFPNGNCTEELARHAGRCGATTIMTTEPMWVDKASLPWRLPRVQLFGAFSRARIELKVALAAIKGVLSNPDGTGRQYCSKRVVRQGSGKLLASVAEAG